MENAIVIDILNIVEDKLREFNIMLPDDFREDSTDPIVGYHYAELHDRIKEYLEEAGLLPAPSLVSGHQINRTEELRSVDTQIQEARFRLSKGSAPHAPFEPDRKS